MPLSEDKELLGVSADATADELRARFRELCLTHHPDRGGEADRFVELRGAYERLLVRALKPRRCEACDGTGSTLLHHGFHVMKKRCDACGGKGKVTRDDE